MIPLPYAAAPEPYTDDEVAPEPAPATPGRTAVPCKYDGTDDTALPGTLTFGFDDEEAATDAYDYSTRNHTIALHCTTTQRTEANQGKCKRQAQKTKPKPKAKAKAEAEANEKVEIVPDMEQQHKEHKVHS